MCRSVRPHICRVRCGRFRAAEVNRVLVARYDRVDRRILPRPHVMIGLNLDNKHEVDELYQRWREAGARIFAEPEDKPWHLREFRVGDLDGNQLRVFYDFSWELRQEQA